MVCFFYKAHARVTRGPYLPLSVCLHATRGTRENLAQVATFRSFVTLFRCWSSGFFSVGAPLFAARRIIPVVPGRSAFAMLAFGDQHLAGVLTCENGGTSLTACLLPLPCVGHGAVAINAAAEVFTNNLCPPFRRHAQPHTDAPRGLFHGRLQPRKMRRLDASTWAITWAASACSSRPSPTMTCSEG